MKITDENRKILIATNVAYYRSLRKITQSELGNAVGKSLGWMNKFEKTSVDQPINQRVSFSPIIIEALAKVLNIPVEWLYEKDRKSPAELEEFSRYYETEHIKPQYEVSSADASNTIIIPSDVHELDSFVDQLRGLNPAQLAILRVAFMKLDAEKE